RDPLGLEFRRVLFRSNAVRKVRDVVADARGPIRITTYIASAEPYPDGASIAGITWREPFVDVRLDLFNASDRAIEDVNLTLQLRSAERRVGEKGATQS